MKYVTPSITETAFNCPHCSALASQGWIEVRGTRRPPKSPLGVFITPGSIPDFLDVRDDKERRKLVDFCTSISTGAPILAEEPTHASSYIFYNLNVSTCFNCKKHAIWIYDKLVYPETGEAPPANPDMSADLLSDYAEANSILDRSPRGAAALLRLCIQKLCIELGLPGKNINDHIGALVAQGLDRRVQQALDAVRVIGNQAVHPGQMDLKDDRATAVSLFRLLNLIVEKLISEPKHIDEIYNSLPGGQIAAIERRDQGRQK